MAIRVRFEEGCGTAVVECSGELRFDDAIRAAEKLWENSDWPGRLAIWDFRTAEFDVSATDVKRISDFIHDHQRDSAPERMAFVTSGDADFGMARMFEVFRGDARTTVRAFRDFDEAVAWTNSTEPDAT